MCISCFFSKKNLLCLVNLVMLAMANELRVFCFCMDLPRIYGDILSFFYIHRHLKTRSNARGIFWCINIYLVLEKEVCEKGFLQLKVQGIRWPFFTMFLELCADCSVFYICIREIDTDNEGFHTDDETLSVLRTNEQYC